MSVRAIILAAGKGTRMKCDLPKVVHTVAGRHIINWVVDAVRSAGIDDVTVVVGHGADEVRSVLPEGVATVEQETQGGTGHATRTALEAMDAVEGTVFVMAGDTPLFTAETIAGLLAAHTGPATVLTTRIADPTGYGRIVRAEDGAVTAIVEESDADAATREIDEVAMSMYAFDGPSLADALAKIGSHNEQGEEYLTDVVGLLATEGGVGSYPAEPEDTVGVNSHEELADVDAAARRRINSALMAEGVWFQDPERAYVDAGVQVESGVRLYAGVHLEGTTTVASGAVIGPETFVVDSSIGSGSRVWYSVVRGAEVGESVDVGPYASLRPGTVLEQGSKAGTFVEIKASTVGAESKVPHLAYVGDASIGKGSNIGAGTITCNYDGFRKNRTVIGDGVFIGSDTMLVAPVEIGDGAYTGAGSVITKDVSPGSLAVERSQQKELPGYAEKRAREADAEDG